MCIRILSLLLTLCLTLIALPGAAEAYETYYCEEQGFSFEHDAEYSVIWKEGSGATIYVDSVGYIPYAIVWCLGERDMSGFDITKQIAKYTQQMRESKGDNLTYIDEELKLDVNGITIPGARYIYKVDEYEIELWVFFQQTENSVRQFSAKFEVGSDTAQATVEAMVRAMSTFQPTRASGAPTQTASGAPIRSDASATYATDLQLVSREMRSADGILIGHYVVPSDFNVNLHLSDSMSDFSIGNPARVTLSAYAPDGCTSYAYRSACDFVEYLDIENAISNVVHQDGAWDRYAMTTMLRARNAEEYADYVFSLLYPNQEVDSVTQVELNAETQAFAQQQKEKLLTRMQALASVTPGISVEGSYWDAVERRYSFNNAGEDYIAVIAVCVGGYQMSTMSYGILNNIGSRCISWGPYGTYIYVTPASEYNAGRAGFDAFMLNTSVSDQFIKFNQDMGMQIRDAMVQGLSLDNASSYSQSGLSDVIEPGEDYEDRFTDYIFDQNEYTTSEGDSIKVPTSFDYVYEDGSGNVFVSNSVPSSDMTILVPNH